MSSNSRSTAQLFLDGARRYGEAYVLDQAVHRPVWKNGVRRPQFGRSGAARESVELGQALTRAAQTDARLHEAVHTVTDSLQAQARDAAAARGGVISVQRIAQGSRAPGVTPTPPEFWDQLLELDAAVGEHDAAMKALLESRDPSRFVRGSRFGQAMGTFAQHRHWESLNLCLADMAIAEAWDAMPSGTTPKAERVGAAALAVGGAWTGEAFRLMHYCDAAVLQSAHLQLHVTDTARQSPLYANRSCVAEGFEALGERATTVYEQLCKANALGTLDLDGPRLVGPAADDVTVVPVPRRSVEAPVRTRGAMSLSF